MRPRGFSGEIRVLFNNSVEKCRWVVPEKKHTGTRFEITARVATISIFMPSSPPPPELNLIQTGPVPRQPCPERSERNHDDGENHLHYLTANIYRPARIFDCVGAYIAFLAMCAMRGFKHSAMGFRASSSWACASARPPPNSVSAGSAFFWKRSYFVLGDMLKKPGPESCRSSTV